MTILPNRRDILRAGAGVGGAAIGSGWLDLLAARAGEGKPPAKACILLWLDGGPSQKDSFDLKPDSKGAGDHKPIKTSVPGIQVSETLPKFAGLMEHAAIIRSMSTPEAEHIRARYHVHTARRPRPGLEYPAIGAIVGSRKGQPNASIPSYVVAGNGSRTSGLSAGFLGTAYEPLRIEDMEKGITHSRPAVDDDRMAEQVGLLRELEQGFYKTHRAEVSAAHLTTIDRALRLMNPKENAAFDLSREPADSADGYGKHFFARGCLLARRLVEVGVPFVEVVWHGWDAHIQCPDRMRKSMPIVDHAMSRLIVDLKDRGLLDRTLVICMGEFGRTPDLDKNVGRNHYAKAWSSVMIGGGLKGGQVVGRTDKEGAEVVDRPVSIADFLATACHLLGIDALADHTIKPDRRPIRIMEQLKPGDEVKLIKELI